MTVRIEDSLERIEEIVKLLQSGSVPIDESIALYEEGMKLSIKTKKSLEMNEIRLKKINAESIKIQARLEQILEEVRLMVEGEPNKAELLKEFCESIMSL